MDTDAITRRIEQLTQDYERGLLTREQLCSLVFLLDRKSFHTKAQHDSI